MRNSLKSYLEEGWTVAALSVLIVFLIGQINPDTELGRIASTDWLMGWMILLSFPGGILSILFFVVFSDLCVECGLSDVIAIWLALFAAGYLQWFRLIPYLFGRNEMIRLRLDRDRNFAPARTRLESYKLPESTFTGEEYRPPLSRATERENVERVSGKDSDEQQYFD